MRATNILARTCYRNAEPKRADLTVGHHKKSAGYGSTPNFHHKKLQNRSSFHHTPASSSAVNGIHVFMQLVRVCANLAA
jgi:hypothetical protein